MYCFDSYSFPYLEHFRVHINLLMYFDAALEGSDHINREMLVSELAERHSHQLATFPARPLPSFQLLAVLQVTESWEESNA